MQRRDLSRSLLAAGALAASGLGLSPAWAHANARNYAGDDTANPLVSPRKAV